MFNHQVILCGLLVAFGFTPIASVEAQLLPDNTLGKENYVINSINSLEDRIDGGAIRGSNLFHSFKEFNVGNNRSVYFSNPNAIQNILSRVTGNIPYSLFPIPYSLFPIPYSLFPIPYSLFPIPCSLFPILYSVLLNQNTVISHCRRRSSATSLQQ